MRDLASDGRGVITHPSGLAVFVGGVWPSEQGLFRIVRGKNRWAEGELIELTHASADRITPFCSHHGVADGECGACPWQFIDYNTQLRAKQQRIESALGKITDTPINDIVPSPVLRGYRIRAQFKTNGEQIGFVSANSKVLAPIDDCPVLSEINRLTLKKLLHQLPQARWRPKNKNRSTTNQSTMNHWTTLDIDEQTSADAVSVNQRLPFQQSHQRQNTMMRQWLAQQCKQIQTHHGPIDSALELFCGSGNFTQILAEAGIKQIVAVDVASTAIDYLNRQQLPGVTALALDLFANNAFEKLLHWQSSFSLLLLDLPREGLKNAKELFQRRTPCRSILYISCDLATFCRDTEVFLQQGYRLKELQPVDTAPHTPHVELLAHLELPKRR